VSLDYETPAKLYLGTTQGKLLKLDYYTGAVDQTLTTTSTGGVGPPTIDPTSRRLHVGTFDGRICAYPVPFQ
jgi:hypothetical protein